MTLQDVKGGVGLFSQDIDLEEFALVCGAHSQRDDDALARFYQHAPADIRDLLAEVERLTTERDHAQIDLTATTQTCRDMEATIASLRAQLAEAERGLKAERAEYEDIRSSLYRDQAELLRCRDALTAANWRNRLLMVILRKVLDQNTRFLPTMRSATNAAVWEDTMQSIRAALAEKENKNETSS